MAELFRIGDEEHELWLSCGPAGFRLHSDAGEAAISLALPLDGGGLGGGGEPWFGGRTRLDSRVHHRPSPRHLRPTPTQPSPIEGEGFRFELTVDGLTRTIHIASLGDRLFIHLDGAAYEVDYVDPVARHAADALGSAADIAHAPMPGAVVAIPVQPGDAVEIGDVLIVIESMKLETAIKAWRPGVVETIHVPLGGGFDRDAALVTLVAVKEA